MQQSIRRIDPVSAMKVLAVLYAVIGLIVGAIFSIVGMIGFGAGAASNPDFPVPGAFGLLFGVAAIVILPVMYAILGAIGGLIMAFMYNLVAQFTGGLQIELSQES
jgi:hypothetical protein